MAVSPAVSNVRHLREASHPEPANKRGSAPMIFVERSDEHGWRGSAPVILPGRCPSIPGLTGKCYKYYRGAAPLSTSPEHPIIRILSISGKFI